MLTEVVSLVRDPSLNFLAGVLLSLPSIASSAGRLDFLFPFQRFVLILWPSLETKKL